MATYLGIDIGGTQIKYGLFDDKYNLSNKGAVDSPTGDNGLQDFINAVEQIINKLGGTKLDGIAFSSPGRIDRKQGIIHVGGSLPYLDGLNVKRTFGEQYENTPIAVENDGKCAALAEAWRGSLKDVHNGAVIVLGTAVGGGIILNDRLYRGRRFLAGELSYMITDMDAKKRTDQFISNNSSAVDMIQAVNHAINNDANKDDGFAAFKAINDSDPRVKTIFETYARDVAALVLNVQTVLDLDTYSIGGGISSEQRLLTEINRQYDLNTSSWPQLEKTIYRPNIVAGQLHNDANLYGAMYNLLTQENHNI
ncbi:hypothetical protein IV38_GL001119 [Lactobacillus selangorensis]|uniref:ROK family protein n=1 Tax=Lactobacillus selangorensis TaxID=81857 RepID=A0A0R2G5J2_9LACO|nr:ROK family protein [Lactobacillus selangorensis]KRN28911.1 hypothetical protein IV38_GL001119 [Lactobacillus selangorensis]KRN32679.1 hypothetical protein IV40_GL000734 [Lactobacillus selangorensis]